MEEDEKCREEEGENKVKIDLSLDRKKVNCGGKNCDAKEQLLVHLSIGAEEEEEGEEEEGTGAALGS
jgi:hypothetical protein